MVILTVLGVPIVLETTQFSIIQFSREGFITTVVNNFTTV